MSDYPLLFSPISINGMELKNRVVVPAMHLNYTPDGSMTDQFVQFYAERAEGGAGLLIIGGASISPVSGGFNMVSIKKDEDIEGMARVAKAAHDGGAKIGVQLYHAGAYSHSMLIGGLKAVSSSTHTSKFTKEEAKGLSLEEIPQVQDDFVQGARRAKEAGFDMVEILGSAGYLISQFLSPFINQREDEYGGSLENRMRFGREVVEKVRAELGDDFCLGIRLAGNDFVPGSHTNKESALFAKVCQEAGVDIINVTGGWHETKVPQITADLPPGGFSYLARGIKRKVDVPVCVSNLIHTPDVAEDILARGDGDLICVGRPAIADPAFANKAERGRADLIATCVSCNQGCFDAVFQMAPIGCMMNPRAGKEAQIPAEPVSADPAQKVVVVGGGPAGCQAALTAARRGHDVVLLEKDDHLGGQPSWYYEGTEKPDFARIGPYFAANLDEAGVDVRLNTEADAEGIAALEPGAVVLAAGCALTMPPIAGLDSPKVVHAWDMLQGKVRPRGKVVVIGGGAVGLETALFVAGKGALTPEQTYFLTLFKGETPEVIDSLIAKGSHDVTVLEMLPKVGQDIGRSTRWVVFGKLKRFGVGIKTGVKVLAVEDAGVSIEKDGEKSLIEADMVIIAAGAAPNDSLAAELKAKGIKVELAGDAAGPANVLKAIAGGFEVGNKI